MDLIKENKELPIEPVVISPPPLVEKIDNNKYIININNLRLECDEKFVKNLWHSARRAVGFYQR